MSADYPERVRIVEVGARDGLQNQPNPVPTGIKVELIDRLAAAGLTHIEAGAFVSPKWVPLMADSMDVMSRIERRPGVTYSVLTPNERGMQAAIEARADEVAVFLAASESFSQKNTNCSIEEAFARAEPILRMAAEHRIPVRGYISCVMGCPFEGDDIDPDTVADIAARLVAAGCHEISLGDTIGRGTPGKTAQLIERVSARVTVSKLAVHFHNTYGQALANILKALECGIAVVDSSVAGLGGCPYAKGATGNVATEDVLYMLTGLGIETGVDLDRVIDTAEFVSDAIAVPIDSNTATAVLARRRAAAG